MTVGRLRDTFVLLLRENDGQTAALSADAERAIRRRVAARWTGRIGSLVVVGALGTAATGAYGDWGGDSAMRSPIATPTIGVAAVTFPVAGGPEFASALAGLTCGDPAPTPHPTEHDVELTLTATNPLADGAPIQTPDEMPSVGGRLSQTADTKLGVLSSSGITYIVERDGVVVGATQSGGVSLGWNERGVGVSGQDDYSTQLVAEWIRCPGDDQSNKPGIEPGAYTVIAMTRVFSTPEAVALSQALGHYSYNAWNLDASSLDPQGIYLPGSYDCAQTIDQQSPARACLPDFTPDAVYNAEDSTVTMLYDTKDLAEEFSVVLVSEPVTVTIPGEEALAWGSNFDWESLGTFDSIDAFTCGASAAGMSLGSESRSWVYTTLSGVSSDAVSAGGTFAATALATGVADGSTAELMPGARVVYLQNDTIELPESNSSTSVNTVVASSSVSAARPVTTDRYAGPQPVSLKVEPATTCPGVDSRTITWATSAVLVGQWRIEAPDGTTTAVDFASDLSMMYYGSITYFGG